jgi:hypothetical protein
MELIINKVEDSFRQSERPGSGIRYTENEVFAEEMRPNYRETTWQITQIHASS